MTARESAKAPEPVQDIGTGGYMVPHAFCCDWCGAEFTPRIRNGARPSRFCQSSHRDAWHNARRREKAEPAAVRVEVPHQATGTKYARILRTLAAGHSLNRFEALALGDSCLYSTIARMRAAGIHVSTRAEIVPRDHRRTWCRRYSLEPAEREKAEALLK